MRSFVNGMIVMALLSSIAFNVYQSGRQSVRCEIGYNQETQAAMDALVNEVAP